MKETLRPLGDKVVVRREEPPKASEGGILLPDNAKEKPTRGVVVAVGPGKPEVSPGGVSGGKDLLIFGYPSGNQHAREEAQKNADKVSSRYETMVSARNPTGNWPAVEHVPASGNGTSALSVKVGDVVLFSTYAGNTVELDGQELLIMREEDILCVVEKSK